MPNEPLLTKERKQLTLTKEGALALIEIIIDMRNTPIWRYPAHVALRNTYYPPEYEKFKSRHHNGAYRLPQRLFPQHQLAFLSTWATAMKDEITPVKSHDPNLTHRENEDANFITALLVHLSQIHKGTTAPPTTVWKGD